MIRDVEQLAAWEKNYVKNEPSDYIRNLRLYEALHTEAQALGIFPLQNPLDGLDDLIRQTKVFNVYRTD